jgi:hypothetical protein
MNSKRQFSKIVLFTFILFINNCVGGGKSREIVLYPEATRINSLDFSILENSQGESSTFFIFGLYPISSSLSMDYALSQAVQKVPGGQSIVNIKTWHETRYFFPLGTVSVLKVKGDVIGIKKVTP